MRGWIGRARGLFAGCAAIGLLGAPSLARACAVCTAGRDEENQLAFLISTIGMSLMPLLAIGTLVFVLWRRFRRLEAAQEAGRQAAAALPGEAPPGPG